MKFVKWNTLLKMTLVMSLFLGLGLMAGCGDDDPTDPTDGGDGGNITGGTMSATLDGTGVLFNESVSGLKDGTTSVCLLAGGIMGSQTLLIAVLGETASYTVNNTSDTSVNITYNATAWFCVSGTVQVTTASDSQMAGSFIGTFEDLQGNVMVVTNGAFDVPIVISN